MLAALSPAPAAKAPPRDVPVTAPAQAAAAAQAQAAAQAAAPSVRVEIRGDRPRQEANFLRGALVLRVLDRGYCVTTGEADLVVTFDQQSDRTVMAVSDGAPGGEQVIPGAGSLAALEAIHRADAGLRRARTPAMNGRACREQSIAVRTNVDEDGEFARNFIAGLSVAGRPLVRGDDDAPGRVCVDREAEVVVIGRGPDCEAVLRIPAVEPGEAATSQVDRAVGAALAVGSEESVGADSVVPEPESELEPEPEPEPEPPSASDDEPGDGSALDLKSEARPPAPPRATLHALVAAAGVVRTGGFDGAAILEAGVSLKPGIILAADLTVIPANLDRGVVAVDLDAMADVGYRLLLSPRSGLRFTGAAGVRVHSYRVDGGPTTWGRTTWVAGAGLAGWWQVGSSLTVEIGVRQRFSGHGWIHEVGLNVAGERGRSTTIFGLGLGWKGRR